VVGHNVYELERLGHQGSNLATDSGPVCATEGKPDARLAERLPRWLSVRRGAMPETCSEALRKGCVGLISTDHSDAKESIPGRGAGAGPSWLRRWRAPTQKVSEMMHSAIEGCKHGPGKHGTDGS